MKLTFERATMRTEARGDLLVFVFSGELTRGTIEAALMQWQCLTTHYPEAGYISLIDRAVWVDSVDLSGMAPSAGPLVGGRPGAVVVRPENLQWFRRYTWNYAEAGIVRGAFTDECAAFSWVQAKAKALAPLSVSRQSTP